MNTGSLPVAKASGAPPPTVRYVVLATAAAQKVAEYTHLLSLYGIVVQQGDPSLWDDAAISAKFASEPKCFAVLHDQAHLLAGETGREIMETTVLGTARSEVVLEGRVRSGAVCKYTEVLVGFVDPSRRLVAPAASTPVFGWDDVFVSLATGKSLHENEGGKISSRDAVVSRFIRDHVHFTKRVDLAHAADLTHAKETIDFTVDPVRFVEKHALLSLALTVPGYGNLMRHVLSGGMFFRAASNRRERNYWWPGLNAGLPFVPKTDPLHEATFMAHDFGHYLLPDLIFTGSEFGCSPRGRRLYVVFRMLSEAVTMVLADILYAEGLRKVHGVSYDWTARKIHPLLTHAECNTGKVLLVPTRSVSEVTPVGGGSTGASATGSSAATTTVGPTPDTGDGWRLNSGFLKELIHANAMFCLKGDEAPWRELMGTATSPAAEKAWDTFKRKFAPFFVADYDWTSKNAEGMTAEGDVFRRWWAASGHLAATVELDTLDSYANKLGAATISLPNSPFVDAVFEHAWNTLVEPCLGAEGASTTSSASTGVSAEVSTSASTSVSTEVSASVSVIASRPVRFVRAFTRYLLGQCAMFARYDSCHLTQPILAALHGFATNLATEQTLDEGQVTHARSVINAYVDELVRQLRITPDDATVFKEVYPLFEPYFVTYDADPAAYDALPAVFARIFSSTN